MNTPHTPPSALSSRRARVLFAAVLVLLLAAALRILHLDDQSLWIDEGTTYYNVLRAPDTVQALATLDVHPPLYYWLLEAWIIFTGESVFALRFFSVLPSLLSVALVYQLARVVDYRRDWFIGAGVPLLSALVLALSDPEITQAQELRMYALRTLLALWSMYAYLRWQHQPGTRRALWWLLSTSLLLHTQYGGLFIPFTQGVHALIFLRGRVRVAAVGWLALIGLTFVPWFALYGWDQRLNDTGLNSGDPSTWDTVVSYTHKFFSRQWPLMLSLLLLGTVRLDYGPRLRLTWRPAGMSFLLLLWAGSTLVISYVANFFLPVLSPRRVLLISPAIAVLIAQGLGNFRPPPLRAFLVAVILVYGVVEVDDYHPKPPWNQVGVQATRYTQPDDLVLMEIYRADFALYYYLDQGLPPGAVSRSLRMWRDAAGGDFIPQLNAELANRETVWVVHWDPSPEIFEVLAAQGFTQTAVYTVDHWGNHINTYRYDRIEAGAPVATYGNGMEMLRSAIYPDARQVDLWWTVAATPQQDYTVSVFLLDETGRLVAQHDAFPQDDQRPTTGWQPGDIIYDPHRLQPADLPPGTYTVGVQVYTWFDNQRSLTSAGEQWAVIGTLTVDARAE